MDNCCQWVIMGTKDFPLLVAEPHADYSSVSSACYQEVSVIGLGNRKEQSLSKSSAARRLSQPNLRGFRS